MFMLRIHFNRVITSYLARNNHKLGNEVYKCMTLSNNPVYFHTNNITSQKHVSDTNKFQDKYVSEQEYFIKTQNDPDSFGANNLVNVQDELDEGDIKEEEYLTNPPNQTQKLSTKKYADMIKELISKRKIKEAIDVLEIRMLKDDKVKPENYIFNLVLGACGRVGYTKKAFSLFNQMKKRGLTVHPGTYTALFNACANSPWPEDGLTRATHLRNLMIEKRYEPNDTNYNAMIKAFGRCGDINIAFSLVDEMINKQFVIKDDTMNFLLQACISDKNAGFRHALLVWRKMIDKKIEPSLFTYNLMLRSIRDCGLGDLDVTKDVLSKLLPENDEFLQLSTGNNINNDDDNKVLEMNKIKGKKHFFDVGDDNIITNNESSSLMIKQKSSDITENRPNLMAHVPHLGNILSLSEIKRPEDRLLLVGGANSFLKNMIDNKCTPDIKTFTQLLDSIPSTISAEKDLVVFMRKINVRADIDFYNMLIKKRSMRFDYESAKDVLDILEHSNMQPNLITYGILALGCKNREDAISLIEEMQKHNYRINVEILGAMLQQACYHNNFQYVMEIMHVCQKEEIAPNAKFIGHLEAFKKKCKYYVDEEKSYTQTQFFRKGYQLFRFRYKTWKEEIKLEENVHPWQQFRDTNETNVVVKDKDRKSRFKPRHSSLFRQKTSSKYDNEDNSKKYISGNSNKYNGTNKEKKYISDKRYDNKKYNSNEKETWS